MAKIGTAHIEIKPVVSAEALEAIVDAIADAVERGVRKGMESEPTVVNVYNSGAEMMTADEAERRRRTRGHHV